MTQKDFWRNSRIAVLGGGSWGTVLANLAAHNCAEVRLWVRNEEQARSMNAQRVNETYVPEMVLDERIRIYHEVHRIFEEGVHGVIWVLPSKVCRGVAQSLASYFRGEEILIHATKGIEEGTLKGISQVLREELPCPRIGVLSGPNLALEISRGEPAATVVASPFEEVTLAGQMIFESDRFRVHRETDVVGVEWAGTLKNVLAIASGLLEGLGLGWNTRAMIVSLGLNEMVRFAEPLGGSARTFLGLAGVGDVVATCSSSLSRNYRVGVALAGGQSLEGALKALGSTAEGVSTTRTIWKFAQERGIEMPITEAMYRLMEGQMDAATALKFIMESPQISMGKSLHSVV